MLAGKIVRVRWVKPYSDAHNHVALGKVLSETLHYLVLNCRTYHFGSNIGGQKACLVPHRYVGGIAEGEKSIRCIPWSRIEVIHALPDGTNWDAQAEINEDGTCFLINGHKTVVAQARDGQHAR